MNLQASASQVCRMRKMSIVTGWAGGGRESKGKYEGDEKGGSAQESKPQGLKPG